MTEQQVYEIILSLAERDDNIRAVLLEGSRANPNAAPDKWQDFDIAYVTRTNAPYIDGTWVKDVFLPHFGEIAVRQIPDNGDPNHVYTWLIQFADGLRIDLTFNSIEFLSRMDARLESCTKILLDKDGGFSDVPPPSEYDYLPKHPEQAEFSLCCNEFWWVSPYVLKALARGQTLHALEMMNECVRTEYAKMLSWFVGARTGFAVNLGKHNWQIGQYVPQEFYTPIIKSYPHADMVEIRSALGGLMIAFPMLASQAAAALGLEYDVDEGERTLRFARDQFPSIEIIAETERLILRKLTPDDFDALYQIMHKPKVMHAWEHGFSEQEVQEWIDRQIERYCTQNRGELAVIRKTDGKLIGQAGLLNITLDGKEVTEIGYLFDDAVWGNGYAHESTKALIDIAFKDYALECLYCTVRPENVASVKVAVRLGFVKVGQYSKNYNGKDMVHDILMLEGKLQPTQNSAKKAGS